MKIITVIKTFFCWHINKYTEIHIKEEDLKTWRTVDIKRVCVRCGKGSYITGFREPCTVHIWHQKNGR